MASEQGGAGGGIESNRRQVRNNEAESLAENETKTQITTTPEQAEKVNYDDKIGQLPRRYSTPSANTTTPGPLSRNPSSCSTMSAQVNADSGVHLSASGSASSSSHRRQQQQQQAQQARPIEPPVTKATLSELDVNKILMNPKLRHDINFDPELHFRPNMDGEKGKQKHEKANQFWNTLLDQLVLFVTDRPAFLNRYGSGDWCLPLLLRAVKEIIQTLVPVRDRAYLDEGLDVDLLMQQFDKGTADLEKLALWLSGVLKSHCAPMRDEWVDDMYTQLSNGNRNNDLGELVKGMRSLLNVLEAMKLDVANHQIRCLRPVLIEDTVHFEQKYHAKRMCQSKTKMDTTAAVAWYNNATRQFSATHRTRKDFGETAIFFEALGRLLMPSSEASQISALQVFQFDEDRINKLRSDLLDAMSLEICMRTYEELLTRTRNHKKHHHQTSPFSSTLSLPMSDEEHSVASWSHEMDLDDDHSLLQAPAHGSRPSSIIGSDAGSMNSSPRSSVIFTAHASTTAADQAKSRDLYNSLVALVHTAPTTPRHTSRWQALAPDMALEILRATGASLDLLPAVEAELATHLCDSSSPLHREVEAQFHTRLMSELSSRVSSFKGLTAVNLFSVATGGRLNNSARSVDAGRELSSLDALIGSSASLRDPREKAGMDDITMRVAHLGILHWRVWSGILYNHCADLGTPEPETP
jgi:hypothetical protein